MLGNSQLTHPSQLSLYAFIGSVCYKLKISSGPPNGWLSWQGSMTVSFNAQDMKWFVWKQICGAKRTPPSPESIGGWSTNGELNEASQLSEYVVAKNKRMFALMRMIMT